MPGLVRKILILAAIDGLLLLPTGPRSRSNPRTKIAYKTGVINTASEETPVPQAVASGSSFEALGIAGLLSVPSGSWLIAITKRSPVAEIKGRQIFVITDIALIPLHSKPEAEAAIARVKAKYTKRSTSGAAVEDADSDDDYDGESILSSDDDVSDDPPRRPSQQRTTSSSIAEDVIGKKGLYGRFAERWFSKRGWQYFWNRHLLNPFIEAGQHHIALPLMQGFVAQQHFQVPNKEGYTRNFLLTLLTRRSINRAGLRYLRRGVDEHGYVANCVETEQLLSDIDKNAEYSFVQMRGSIPIFFQQSPYALKPKPILMHSESANKAAFQTHFKRLKDRYGEIQAVNLVEKHSQEAVVGNMYEKNAQELEDPKIKFEWFDFHAECRGMKFENVSLLIDRVGNMVDEYGWTEERNDKIEKTQTGVIRTNCMDCLDRTNVVMSNFARRAIELQLTQLNIDPAKLDTSLNFMNLLWADNGDAISKQYSSTAALKGDFTRTKKRNISGALADFGLTLTRFWNNIIGDFFTQAAIDYLLGNVSALVFVEFEAKMMSGDPAVSISKVRQNAIETSSRLVIADSNEEMIGGWTLLTPTEENTLRTFPFKEIVLLLTDTALYYCKFDFSMDKVSAFERISLDNITGLQYGAYITSTLTSAQVDEKQNVGLVIKYEPGKDDILRINTRSLTANVSRENPDIAAEAAVPPPGEDETSDMNKSDDSKPVSKSTPKSSSSSSDPNSERILAFKAISADSSVQNYGRLPSPMRKSAESNEEALVLNVCNEIQRACKIVNPSLGRTTENGAATEDGDTDEPKPPSFIEKRDVVSLLEAKKSTGLLEQVGYSIRRWVWA
ncbi:Synaptojanin-2 [Dactylellina cionopaga]|nr:Synaptojanin-2 [Dactylellina cionopaga]